MEVRSEIFPTLKKRVAFLKQQKETEMEITELSMCLFRASIVLGITYQ